MSDPVTPAELRRGLLAQLDGDFAEAERLYRRALGDPRLADVAHRHLILLLERQHRWDEAVDECRAMLRQRPELAEIKVNLATDLLGLGRYAEAWPLYEARAALDAGRVRPNLPYPEWDGRPVRSLTVWDEQGFGDAIQFARFIPDLVGRGIAVTAFIRPELAPLFQNLGAVIVPAEGKLKAPLAEAWAMIGSLPGRLGVNLEDLPGRVDYLAAPADRRAAWAGRLPPGARIGVVARGKAAHANDANRSLPHEASAFLQTLPGAVNLLPGETRLPIRDFADTAAVVEQLSLVITVDTAIAHLAGALGKPCWVLLPYAGVDWRWLHDRSDSPWYPSLRLYRQPTAGDWGSVLREVARDLPAVLAASPVAAG